MNFDFKDLVYFIINNDKKYGYTPLNILNQNLGFCTKSCVKNLKLKSFINKIKNQYTPCKAISPLSIYSKATSFSFQSFI